MSFHPCTCPYGVAPIPWQCMTLTFMNKVNSDNRKNQSKFPKANTTYLHTPCARSTVILEKINLNFIWQISHIYIFHAQGQQ